MAKNSIKQIIPTPLSGGVVRKRSSRLRGGESVSSLARGVATILAMGVFLAGCGAGISGLPKLEEQQTEAGAEEQFRDYRLGTGDRLSIVVFGQADLSGEFEIDGAGQVSIPLAGQIKASGLTITELQTELAKVLDEAYLVNPRVSIEVVNYRPFYVLGEVNRPGRFDYASGLDVRQAVALAGGFTRRGLQSAVKLIRDEEEKGRTEYEAGLDTLVLPGDTIEVVRRVF